MLSNSIQVQKRLKAMVPKLGAAAVPQAIHRCLP